MQTFNPVPKDGLGNFINTKNLPDCTQSGIYKCRIANATYNHGTSNKGNEFSNISLTLAVLNHGEPCLKLNVSVFISGTSQALQDLLYFTNSKDAQGNLYLADPVHKEGDKDGKHWSIDTFDQFINKDVNAMVTFQGMAVSAKTGTQYPTFNLLGFCSDSYQSAAEHYANAPANLYKQTVNKLLGQAPRVQAQPQQGYAPQAPAYAQQVQQPYAPQAQGPVGQAYAQMQAQGQVVNPDNKDLNDPLPF